MRLHSKVAPPSRSSRKNALIVPRYITLMQKCVEFGVQDCFIRNTHFTDLCVLLYSLDIANIRAALRRRAADKDRKRHIETHDISQAEAVKFLKGGGNSGG